MRAVRTTHNGIRSGPQHIERALPVPSIGAEIGEHAVWREHDRNGAEQCKQRGSDTKCGGPTRRGGGPKFHVGARRFAEIGGVYGHA